MAYQSNEMKTLHCICKSIITEEYKKNKLSCWQHKWSSHSEMVKEVLIRIYKTMFDAYTESSFRMQVDGPWMPVTSFMNQMMPWQNRYKQNWMAMIW